MGFDSALRIPHSALGTSSSQERGDKPRGSLVDDGWRLLALDPSSAMTGYAVLDGAGAVVDVGRLTPERGRDDVRDRCHAMAEDAVALCKEVNPAVVVVEMPSHLPARAGRRSRGTGLAIYGFAVGYMTRALAAPPWMHELILVQPETWTRGTPKKDRARMLAARFRESLLAEAKWNDAADAVGLGLWWLSKFRISDCGLRNREVRA